MGNKGGGGDGVKELCLLYAFFPCVCLSIIAWGLSAEVLGTKEIVF